jgi:1-acyl-sn-glycerol-3-phosphate acyltransferase
MTPPVIVATFQGLSHILWPYFRFFLNIKFENKYYLKKLKRPFIIIANHASYLDPFIVGAAFFATGQRLPYFYPMANDPLVNMPVIGSFTRALGGFPALKGAGLEKSSQLPFRVLRKNYNLLIFPEGGRWKFKGRPKKARRGVAYIASKTNIPIIPIRITGHRPFWSIKRALANNPKLRVSIGKPFYLHEIYPRSPKSKKELAQAAEIIMAQVKHLCDFHKSRLNKQGVLKVARWTRLWFSKEHTGKSSGQRECDSYRRFLTPRAPKRLATIQCRVTRSTSTSSKTRHRPSRNV